MVAISCWQLAVSPEDVSMIPRPPARETAMAREDAEKALEAAYRERLELEKRNKMLQADVADLQQGLDSIEERARNELGLIKQDEVFFRLITPQGKK